MKIDLPLIKRKKKEITEYPPRIHSEEYLVMRKRVQALNELIIKSQKTIYLFRRLDVTEENGKCSSSYAISYTKHWGGLADLTHAFYQLLTTHLAEGEQLETDARCFTVRGGGYEIIYSLEGYKKNADTVGYIRHGEVRKELLRRMPTDLVFKRKKVLTPEAREEVAARMRSEEWLQAYPNPADRLAAIVKAMK